MHNTFVASVQHAALALGISKAFVGFIVASLVGGAQVLMVLLTTLTTAFVVSTGKSAWYLGVQLLAVYAAFAVTFYLLPN
jgi:Ca2+/H+ antiporter